MRLYHGTSALRAEAIRRDGLRPGTFVTRDLRWAKVYAVKAAARDGGPEHRACLIVTIEAAPEDLRRDPHPHAGAERAAALTRCLPAIELREFHWRPLRAATPEQVNAMAVIP